MARTGPLTKDSTTVTLGLAQIRIGLSSTYIGQVGPILGSSASIGAMASTKFMGSSEVFRLESGYPMLEDAVFPLRESAAMECAFKEITPYNMALAQGKDPTASDYSAAHTGSISLGTITAPVSLRLEAVYTYPDGSNLMYIIFPRAQVVSVTELEFAAEEPSAVTISIESKRADGGISGGHAIWNDKPLGRIIWDDGSTLTTTTTSTSP